MSRAFPSVAERARARAIAPGAAQRDRVQAHNIPGVKPLDATPYFNNCPNASCNVVFNCFCPIIVCSFLACLLLIFVCFVFCCIMSPHKGNGYLLVFSLIDRDWTCQLCVSVAVWIEWELRWTNSDWTCFSVHAYQFHNVGESSTNSQMHVNLSVFIPPVQWVVSQNFLKFKFSTNWIDFFLHFRCLSMKAPDRYVAISLAARVRFRSAGFGFVRKRSGGLGRSPVALRLRG